MIIGIGIDLVEIERVDRLLRRYPGRAARRLFTALEVERCRTSRLPKESLAARFAAKEALFKALGTGWSEGASWTEVEVVSAESGAPTLRLYGRTQQLAAARGVRSMHVTLTHTAGVAGAFVVLEGDRD